MIIIGNKQSVGIRYIPKKTIDFILTLSTIKLLS